LKELIIAGIYMKKIILLILLTFAIEVFGFNFPNILSIVRDDGYSIDLNSQLISNKEYDGTNVQWLIDLGGQRKLYNMVIFTNGSCSPNFYYTDSKGVIQLIPFTKEGNKYIATINKKISGYIGVSTYNDSVITSATLNARTLSFSLSRIIAMLAIYYAGVFLFSIQKMPDYHLNSDSE